MTDLSSQLNPSGCWNEVTHLTGGNHICGKIFLKNGKVVLCMVCKVKRLATAKALYNEKKKTLEWIDSLNFTTNVTAVKQKQLNEEIKQIENEVPEVLEK